MVFRLAWSRRCAIALILIELVLSVVVLGPLDFVADFQAIMAEPVPADVLSAPNHNASVNRLVFLYAFIVIGQLLVSLAIVYYLTRPHVRKLFGASDPPPAQSRNSP